MLKITIDEIVTTTVTTAAKTTRNIISIGVMMMMKRIMMKEGEEDEVTKEETNNENENVIRINAHRPEDSLTMMKDLIVTTVIEDNEIESEMMMMMMMFDEGGGTAVKILLLQPPQVPLPLRRIEHAIIKIEGMEDRNETMCVIMTDIDTTIVTSIDKTQKRTRVPHILFQGAQVAVLALILRNTILIQKVTDDRAEPIITITNNRHRFPFLVVLHPHNICRCLIFTMVASHHHRTHHRRHTLFSSHRRLHNHNYLHHLNQITTNDLRTTKRDHRTTTVTTATGMLKKIALAIATIILLHLQRL